MNHFPFHIGDYAEATGHLSFVEDATYFRCIRKYYSTEKALPREISQVQRLIGAKTKEEKNSVEVVLNEFFILEEDGWHNKRCDQELERYHEGSSSSNSDVLVMTSVDPQFNTGVQPLLFSIYANTPGTSNTNTNCNVMACKPVGSRVRAALTLAGSVPASLVFGVSMYDS